MPEAPINENGDPLYAKNKIGAAKHGFVPLPARDPMLAAGGAFAVSSISAKARESIWIGSAS